MKKVVYLCGDSQSSRIKYHAMKEHFSIDTVIMEKDVPLATFLKRRLKKLGLLTVFGQILFMLFVAAPLRIFYKERVNELLRDAGLQDGDIPNNIVTRVESVNSSESIALLAEMDPDLVIINGTRILSKTLLNYLNCPVINMHAGITPRYRGVHGAYWALANGDMQNCGVTVHRVDAGIDTGAVIAQTLISPTEKDSFISYPYLQTIAGLPLLIEAAKKVLHGTELESVKPDLNSKLWSHPTLWQYVRNRIVNGVR